MTPLINQTNYEIDKEIKMSPPTAPSHESSSEDNEDKEKDEHLSDIMKSYKILDNKLDESLKKIKNRKQKKNYG